MNDNTTTNIQLDVQTALMQDSQTQDYGIEVIDSKKKALGDLQNEKTNFVNNQKTLKDNKGIKEDEFKNYCWTSIYKKYEGDFKDTLKGFLKSDLFKNKIIHPFYKSICLVITRRLDNVYVQ